MMDPEVYRCTEHWVEAADWIVWQLTGVYVRDACTVGYKAIYQDGAYPAAAFLAALNPGFADFVTDKVERPIAQLGEHVGSLTATAATWTGLPLPRLPVACAVWKPKPDLRTATESWLAAGAPHHAVLSTALGTDALWDFAEMSRTELVVIDATTTSRGFANELRWNQAFHHLARGL